MLTTNLIYKNHDLLEVLKETREAVEQKFLNNGEPFVLRQSFGHGCNLENDWGGGIAAYLFVKQPQMFEATKEKEVRELGGFSFAGVALYGQHKVTGYNLYTQTNGGSGSFSYKALYMAVYNMLANELESIPHSGDVNKFVQVALPMIGSGIAGGDPDICLFYMQLAICDAYEALEHSFVNIQVDIVIWDDVRVKMGGEFIVNPRENIDYNSLLDPRNDNFNETLANIPINLYKYDTTKKIKSYVVL